MSKKLNTTKQIEVDFIHSGEDLIIVSSARVEVDGITYSIGLGRSGITIADADRTISGYVNANLVNVVREMVAMLKNNAKKEAL